MFSLLALGSRARKKNKLYTLMTSPCSDNAILNKFDSILRKGITEILNVDLDDIQWSQANLPVSAGALGSGVQLRWHLPTSWLLPHQHCYSRIPSFHQHSPTFQMAIQTMHDLLDHPIMCHGTTSRITTYAEGVGSASRGSPACKYMYPTDDRLEQGTHSCSIIQACR